MCLIELTMLQVVIEVSSITGVSYQGSTPMVSEVSPVPKISIPTSSFGIF